MVIDTPKNRVGTLHASLQQLDCSGPLCVHPFDTSGIVLVPQLLNVTENYSELTELVLERITQLTLFLVASMGIM